MHKCAYIVDARTNVQIVQITVDSNNFIEKFTGKHFIRNIYADILCYSMYIYLI